jgi:hypothetical protein
VPNVRKVVAYELLSLDGVAERPDGFFADWDDAMDANLGAVIGAQDSVILGRRSYEEWAEFWPGSDIEPFATFINGAPRRLAGDPARTDPDRELAGWLPARRLPHHPVGEQYGEDNRAQIALLYARLRTARVPANGGL